MTANVIPPAVISDKIRALLAGIERGRTTITGAPRSFHTMIDNNDQEVKIPYVVMAGSAPFERGNELLQKMADAIPEDCQFVIWRRKPEIIQDVPFQRAPRLSVSFRLALLDGDGVPLQPTAFATGEGEYPHEIETGD